MATSKKKDPLGTQPAHAMDEADDDASARNVWLAGLGAFAKAQAEGNKVFDSLVKEGLAIQRKTQALAEDRLAEASKRMAEMTARASDGALPWGRLEGIFEERVARALGRLGTPSAQDMVELRARLDRIESLLQPNPERSPAPAAASDRRHSAAVKKTRG